MASYRAQNERLQVLGRLMPQQQPPVSPGLSLAARGQTQAENHRPPELVNALVQRHFFPAEGAVADGVGENVPVMEDRLEDEQRRLKEYHKLVRRRAAETSRMIRAEQDAKLKLANAARERLQAAKDFGTKVAVGNARVLLRKGQGSPSPAKAAAPAASTASGPAGPPSPREPVAPKQLCRQDQDQLEKEHYPVPPPKPEAAPSEESEAEEAKDAEAEAEPEPAPAPRGPPASVAARRRLLSHCPFAADELRALEEAEQARLEAAAEPGPGSGLPPGAMSPMQLPVGQFQGQGGFKTRVLQPVQIPSSQRPVGKMFKSKPLPLAVSLSDKTGLGRIAERAAEMGIGTRILLPRPCACPHAASLFDPLYPEKCARNCPFYKQPARYEALLTNMLRAADVI
ncbi:hypothetical protein HYH03_003221 [Edaphochlamys debaryana]|uniref:Uncharacterized protein n=1 Tax=Edaphochlamys debaryana TaxID=47281 RepID=A0A835YAH4_9CHLO|nr:hypothetical protein HYH03_003221 [Edaphochlamys debaryana]|eukprot:KAG2499036.1 hypothetical protein HYH03_003221 [Edaphochlamys debaryana]